MERASAGPASGLPVLAQFVVRFALPALVFRSLATRQVAEVLNVITLAWGDKFEPTPLPMPGITKVG